MLMSVVKLQARCYGYRCHPVHPVRSRLHAHTITFLINDLSRLWGGETTLLMFTAFAQHMDSRVHTTLHLLS
jgi:hypothetical protein